MDIQTKIQKGLKTRWNDLHNRKTTILRLCEKYAGWTLPYMFPPDNQSPDVEMPIEIDSIGSQGVNHLSNKIVSTLFPAKTLFFRLKVDQNIRDYIETAMRLAQQGGDDTDDADLKAQIETAVLAAETELSKSEKRAEQHLDMVQYRPQAINAVKLLIITGNALVFHPEDGGAVKVYNLRDYHVVRDCDGNVVEIMTRETKAFNTFHPEVQNRLRHDAAYRRINSNPEIGAGKAYEEWTPVTIYTSICLEDDGKYHVRQFADEIDLGIHKAYTKDGLRWIPLVWNLVNGEDYGRGLVADFAGAFHALMILNNSLLNLSAIMGDIKFFVKPTSMIDVVEVQNSLPGSYHSGDPQDIGTAQFNKMMEANFIEQQIERYQKQIAQAFMLTQQLRRDAERVTAEEIRQDVDELETSNSGIYSRLAATWQQQTANLALEDTHFVGVTQGMIRPQVITGMDSLSRAGEAYNMRLFMTDLAMLNGVPEDIRMGIKPPQFIQQIAQYHQVPYEAWVMTPNELAARQQQEQQNAMMLQQQQGEQQLQVESAKAAAKE
ncbi:putative head-to-tail joining protein [Rhizobium phage RHEph08]|uniref:Putative head-to-tail joining protein n=2 Tax=Cuernavacavirus TaxID=2731935 RepID=L7TN44_9CAUD|nr:putative head-to-tail joining protein [Rhizobium phage RHEph08]YP_009793280.1 putative head-to-tail joining protein [Rhizobium phage RHEph09]AGC35967.1 putative head-to-tail joining protein [Rhizobium phage RHEph08]AGC36021.1 putative head-to-tail joining protein [Rhizobium phage RHEph09]